MRRGPHAAEEIIEVDELVRCVSILVGKSEPEKHRIEPEELFELNDDRYRSPFTLVERFLSETFFQSNDRRLNAWTSYRRDRRLSAVKEVHVDAHAFGSDLFHIALEKFREMVAAQSGDLDALRPRAAVVQNVCAKTGGYIARIDAEQLGIAVIELGGGRLVMTDRIDHAVGLEMLARIGDRVSAGQPLVRVFSSHSDVSRVVVRIESAIALSAEVVTPPTLIAGRVE